MKVLRKQMTKKVAITTYIRPHCDHSTTFIAAFKA